MLKVETEVRRMQEAMGHGCNLMQSAKTTSATVHFHRWLVK